MKDEEDIPIVGYVLNLGRHWVAILREDGGIILQNLSNVVLGDSGEVVNLNDPSKFKEETRMLLETYHPNNIAVRTICLMPDGSVVSDPDGISPKGELTSEQYQIIEPTIFSSRRFFSRKFSKNNQ